MSMRVNLTKGDCELPCGCHVQLSSLLKNSMEAVKAAVKSCGHAEHNNDIERAMLALEIEASLVSKSPEIALIIRRKLARTSADFPFDPSDG